MTHDPKPACEDPMFAKASPPPLGVVIPLYNKRSEVKRAIHSALNQTVRVTEIVVVDDGSTDGGAELVAEIRDDRIRLVRQPNRGVSSARNRGIHESRADLIALLDADDEWAPWHIEEIATLSTEFPTAGAYATAFALDCPGTTAQIRTTTRMPAAVHRGLLPDYFETRGALWTSAVAIWKDAFKVAGGFRTGLNRGEDLDMWFRVALFYPIAYSTRVSAVYHWTASNRVTMTAGPGDFFLRESLSEAIQNPSIPASVKRRATRYADREVLRHVGNLLRHGMRSAALATLRQQQSRQWTKPEWLLFRLLTLLPESLTDLVNLLRPVARRVLRCGSMLRDPKRWRTIDYR